MTNTNTNNVVSMPGVNVRKVDGGTLDAAHKQWATRPADEAVWTIDELLTRTRAQREQSAAKSGVSWDSLRVEADGEALALVGKGGVGASLTNWSMGQLANAAGAPASYLAKLPASLAAECLSHGLSNTVERERDAQLLFRRGEGGALSLRGITTTAYERVWDHEVAQGIARACERGSWQAAEAFKRAGGNVEHAWGQVGQPLPLGWVGDRSMFAAIFDYSGAVSHKGSELTRFALFENSEVGAAKLRITFGYLDFVCGNFLLWGCEDVHEVAFTHVGSIRERFAQVGETLNRQLGSGEVETLTERIDAGRAYILGDTEEKAQAVARAATGLPKALVADAFERAANTPRYGDPRSAWGLFNGLTEASQHVAAHADKRTEIDAKAARLMGLLDR